MSDKENDPNWGGAREGAGRPPITNGKLVRRSIGITEAQLAHLSEKYGELSGPIRMLIDLDRRATAAGVDLAALLGDVTG